MNVMVVGLLSIALYGVVLALWLSFDKRRSLGAKREVVEP